MLEVRTGAVIRSLGLGRSFPREPCSLLVQRGDDDSGEDFQNSFKIFLEFRFRVQNQVQKQSKCKYKTNTFFAKNLFDAAAI